MARKRIPKFSSETAEQDFWAAHDSNEYVDWTQGGIGIFPNLKPSTKTISLRLPASLLEALKAIANKQDVPYQSLMKIFLADRIKREMARPDNKRLAKISRS